MSTVDSEAENSDRLPDTNLDLDNVDLANETFTVDDAIENSGYGKFQLLISGFAGFIMMADAMEMMILSILSPALACEWKITEMEQALITTCVFIGMAFSSVIWGGFCDRHGRRTGLMAMSFSTFAFATASAFSPNYYVFLILRTLTGVCLGGMPQSTTYYSEFLPRAHRALCILLFYMFWSFGGIFEAVIALFVMEPLGWRWLLVLSTLPLLISAFGCWFVPETPRFLVTSGEPHKAYETLSLIARLNGRKILPGKLIQRNENTENEKMGRFLDLLSREVVVTTLLVWFIWFISTFCYYGIILMTTVIFQGKNECPDNFNTTISLQNDKSACKILNHEDYLGIVYTSISEFPGLIACAIMFQFFGRKTTMAIDFSIFGVFTLLLLLCVSRTWVTVFIFIARAFIGAVFSSVFIYTPEVYPTTMRAVGMGSASGMGRVGALLTPFVAEVISRKFSLSTSIIIYGAGGLLAAAAPLFLPIETRGRKMKDLLFEEDSSVDLEAVDPKSVTSALS